MTARILRIACWVLGVGAFVSVVVSAGLGELRGYAAMLAGPGCAVLLVYAATCLWDVWGWQVVFTGTSERRVRFADLYLIRLAGEAVNNVTPFVDIGGEFLKVVLAAKRFGIEKRAVLATVVIERTALLSTEVLFWFLGLEAALLWVPGARAAQTVWIVMICVFVFLIAALYWIQQKGFFAAFYGLYKRFVKTEEAIARELELKIQDVDAQIARFYAQRGRNAATLALHLAGWAAGGVETWLMFRAFGVPLTFLDGIILEAMLQLLKTVSFFIPGNLGAQEGGLALFGTWFGYAGPAGVAVSLLKRLRQLLWTGVGFGVWSWMARQTDSRDLSPSHHTRTPHVGSAGPG